MRTSILFLILTGLVLFACGTQEAADKKASMHLAFSTDNAGLQLPDGFQVVEVVDTTGFGRHLAVNTNGDIYMNLRRKTEAGGLVALRDVDGDGIADQKSYFGETQGTGIRIKDDHLYFSTDTSIHRVKLDAENLVPEGQVETIASGFPLERQHATKSFALDDSNGLYVNVGAPSNACQEQDRQLESPGQDPCPILELYGGVWKFRSDVKGQTQSVDGQRFATGMRNMVALNWNSMVGKLYGVQHGRDMLHNWFPDKYTDELPAEEFFRIEEGNDFGWPYCFYDQIKSKKVLGPEYGGDGKEQGRCADMDQPIMAFPGHYAPNDILFYTGESFPDRYKNGAFIAFHGSWNREGDNGGQQGYNIVFVPFEGDLPSSDWEVFADGFEGPEDVMAPRDAIHRPTGLALGPDGSLYVSDSRKGKIYRIVYTAGA